MYEELIKELQYVRTMEEVRAAHGDILMTNCDYFRDAVGYLKEYEESQKETNVTMFDLLGIRA